MSGHELSVRDIRRNYGGVKALDGVSFDVAPNTIHGLIGPNGSGKTTLFDVLSGFTRPDAGVIRAGGVDLATMDASSRARHGVGRTFQLPNVLAENTVSENVLLGTAAKTRARSRLGMVGQHPNSEHERLAQRALEQVELVHLADTPTGELSYGTQRIVDIARVLAARPRLVLLDEPAAGMSTTDRDLIIRIVRRLREEEVTVVVIEHDMKLIGEICDRVTVLSAGVVIAEGTSLEVQSNVAVVAAYLGAGDVDNH
jgi:ABC-type branched-subunit amino acid transport system ATPase component